MSIFGLLRENEKGRSRRVCGGKSLPTPCLEGGLGRGGKSRRPPKNFRRGGAVGRGGGGGRVVGCRRGVVWSAGRGAVDRRRRCEVGAAAVRRSDVEGGGHRGREAALLGWIEATSRAQRRGSGGRGGPWGWGWWVVGWLDRSEVGGAAPGERSGPAGRLLSGAGCGRVCVQRGWPGRGQASGWGEGGRDSS